MEWQREYHRCKGVTGDMPLPVMKPSMIDPVEVGEDRMNFDR